MGNSYRGKAKKGTDMIGGPSKLNRYLLTGAGTLGLLIASGRGAEAQDLQVIQAQINAMQATIKALEKQVQDAKSQAAAAQTAASDSKSDLDLKVKWRGAPEFSSNDGKFKAKVRGRLHVDYNAIDQDEAITGRPDVSAAEIRRARLGVEGVLWYDVKYIVEVDFANDAVSLKDAYAEYTGLAKDLGLRVGNFKTFNSLDQLNSSNYRTFQETPALVEAWGIDRQIGAAAIYAKDHYTLSAGIFGPYSSNDERWLEDVKTGSARLTVAPINSDVNGVHQVVHLGASWRYREQAEHLRSPSSATLDPLSDQFFQYRARGADLHLADRFVSTPGIFDADTFWGLEALVIWKSFHVQAEYSELEAEVSPLFNGADPTYTGWYVDAGWFITGETLEYNKGVYGRPKVKNPVVWSKGGGWGAWQLAFRYDVVDLTDKAITLQGNTAGTSPQPTSVNCTNCGEQNTWIVGVNWWLNDYSRIQFQYGESDVEGGALLLANGTSANRNDGATIKGFGTRFQVDW
jgi:phosphate-selective porin OprO/OprP